MRVSVVSAVRGRPLQKRPSCNRTVAKLPKIRPPPVRVGRNIVGVLMEVPVGRLLPVVSGECLRRISAKQCVAYAGTEGIDVNPAAASESCSNFKYVGVNARSEVVKNLFDALLMKTFVAAVTHEVSEKRGRRRHSTLQGNGDARKVRLARHRAEGTEKVRRPGDGVRGCPGGD